MGNNGKIKPIETHYKGYHFRSRTEARWAVCFDALNIQYEYEKEGYDLGELGWYLPDFWLPEYQMFAEVKGEMFTENELDKCKCLVENIPDSGCLLLIGQPKRMPYFGYVNLLPAHIITLDQNTGVPYETTELNSDTEKSIIYVSRSRQLYSFENPVVLLHFIVQNTKMAITQSIRTFPLCHTKDEMLDVPTIDYAVKKARSARFEFKG